MGAWIETMPPTTRPELKNGVAPCMGAWIETSQRTPWKKRGARSHPVWVRGLKLNSEWTNTHIIKSHPVWVRGLKRSVSDEY